MCIIEEYTDVYLADVRQRRVLQRCPLNNSVGYCYHTRVINRGERFHDRPTRHYQYARPRPEMSSLRHRIVDPREPARRGSLDYPRRQSRRSNNFRVLFPFLRRSPGSDEESEELSPRGRPRSRPSASTPEIPIPPIQREPRATPPRRPPQIRVVSPRVRTPTRENPLPRRPEMSSPRERPRPWPRPRPPRTPYPVVIHQDPVAAPARPARYRRPPPPPPPPQPPPSSTVPPPATFPMQPPPAPPAKKFRPPRERSPVTEREPIRKPRSNPTTPVQIHNPSTPRPEQHPGSGSESRHVRFSDTVDHVSLSSDGVASPAMPPRYYSGFSSSAIHRDHSPGSYGQRRPTSPFPGPRGAARQTYTYAYPATRSHSSPPRPLSPSRYRQHGSAPVGEHGRRGSTGHPVQERSPARILAEGKPLYERARPYEELQRQREGAQSPSQGRWRRRRWGSDWYTEIRSGDERVARDKGNPSRWWHWR